MELVEEPTPPSEHHGRRRRTTMVSAIATLAVAGTLFLAACEKIAPDNAITTPITPEIAASQDSAQAALGKLAIKGRAPKTGYSRKQFGDGWAQAGACNMRDRILARDMAEEKLRSETDCDVMSGTLNDPYTGKTLIFNRTDSSAIQIDHVVALSDAWQKGAQQLTAERREEFANDPLELLAVDGPANNKKGDADAATWLPPNKPYRCQYIARQIAVKLKYDLWVTQAEHDAMAGVLATCPQQVLPIVQPQR